jgi:exopolysaccharide biosynthesis polyprenyl glycosylphosphotransferase
MELPEQYSLESREIRAVNRMRRFSPPSLGLQVSERVLLLRVVDILLLNGALLLALVISTEYWPDSGPLFFAWKWPATLIVVWILFSALFDLYDLARAASTTYSLRAAVPAAALTAVTYLAIPWFTPTLANRTYGFAFLVLSVAAIAIWRFVYAQLFTQPSFQRRTIIVGTDQPGQILAQALLKRRFAQVDANPFRGTSHVPLGFVTYDDLAQERSSVAGLPVLGDARHLIRLARELNVEEIVLALPGDMPVDRQLYEAIMDCRELGIDMAKMTTVYERLMVRVPVECAGWDVETAAGIKDTPFMRLYMGLKRLADIVVGLCGLMVLALMIPAIALVNKFTSPGDLFYYQQRVGLGGRPFRIIKFRSMRPDAESAKGATWAQTDDDRVTPVGRWLRKLHLDELPQVINVLRGEMSLVGPRPERPEFVGQLSREVTFYRARHGLRPGITGWAQIHQDYGSSVADARVKLEYDLYYVKRLSLWLDVVIMLRTITKVFGLRGR